MNITQQIWLDLEGLTLISDNSPKIRLRKKEIQLLLFFAKNPNRIIDRLSLLELVWDYNIYAQTNTLAVHINNLRKKLQNFRDLKIETIYGVGYKFNNQLGSPRDS
ncbi:hypothetical protein GF376_01460 [Candidatus Peregrinibacteria bacterium]|nr:hypothetical protein [Candidatus Peregrinibacteria bacterium]